MIRYLLWGLAGFGWTILAFLVGFMVTFPSDVVAARIEHESVAATDKQFAVHMGSIRPWFTGARATDLTVYSLKRARRTKDNPDPGYDRSPMITADSVVVHARPVAWMMGQRAIGWAASVLGGELDGNYAESASAVDVDLALDGVDLGKLGLAGEDRLILLSGILAGEATFHFDLEDTKASTGSLTLSAEGLGLLEGSKVAGFGLPAAPFSKAVLSAEVDNGKITLKEGTFEGSIMSATLSGDITINKKILRSRHKLDFAFTLPDEFDQLASLSPTLKRSKDDEGRYHCSVNGQLFAPTFRCGKTTSPRRAKAGDDEVDSPIVNRGADADMSDEERRIAREERIKERRERLKKRREEAAKARGEDPMAPEPLEPGPRRPNDFGDVDFPPEPPPKGEFFPEEDLQGPPDVELAPPDDNWLPGDDQTR